MEWESTKEVLIVSDADSKDSNCTMYDLDNGTVIEIHRDGNSVRNGLQLIGYDYLMSAFADRPKLKIWQLGQTNTVNRRMASPGVVSALAVTRNGLYCVAGIGIFVYIWEVATGNLEAHFECHLQNITCIKFTSDDSHFITGGKDGFVYVFSLSKALEHRESALDIPKPRCTWGDHSSEVTDIYVGSMGIYGRVATVSRDYTCRIYELDTGYSLHTIKMAVSLTAVTMDKCENFLYLGSAEGGIYKINLFQMHEAEVRYGDNEIKQEYEGHVKEIKCLCVSQSGKYLLSGSADHKCIVWNICNSNPIHQLHFQGEVTNIITSELPPGIKNRKYLPRLFIGDFQKIFEDGDEFIPINIIDRDLSLFHAGTPDQFFDSSVMNYSNDDLEKKILLHSTTIDEMARINNDMYSFVLGNNFHKGVDDESGSSN